MTTPPYSTGDIRIVVQDGYAVLRLSGEIDGAAVQAFQRSHRALGSSPPVAAIDAEAVTYMSSQGIALLLQQTDAFRATGHLPVLRRPSRVTQRIVWLTGVDALFDVR